jgi:hypothetical protein
MTETVDIPIPLDADAAAALTNDRQRQAIGRIISRLLRPRPGEDPLLDAMRRFSADALAKGLTPELLEAELAAHKTERSR